MNNIYNWYKIFNITEFLALNIGSKIYDLNLNGVGQSTFKVYLGNIVSVNYLDEFMPVNLYTEALYEKNSYAIYRDDSTGDVYFGFITE